MPPAQSTDPAPMPAPKMPKNKNVMNKLAKTLVALVLIGAGAGAGYFYRDSQAKDDAKVSTAEINSLKAKNTKLTKDLAEAKGETSTATSVTPSSATLESIEASVKSGNYAALVGYSATTVKVIIAASEGVGDRTPAQMAEDIKYLDAGTDPWDFALSATTLAGYQAGDYKQYFPATAFVGKSANNYVVSFQFDANGKINGLFMSAADLL